MAAATSITPGTRFDRWVVIGPAEKDNGGNRRVLCRCDCGTVRPVTGTRLRSGGSRSCGCLRSDQLTVHGEARRGEMTTEYRIWEKMKRRCEVSSDPAFRYYGGRGIRVCERWASFDAFLEDMGRRPSLKHSIDRIDNDGDYTPSNCRWATRRDQCRNQRSNVRVEYRGKSYVLSELVDLLGKDYMLVYLRIRRGWDVDRAINEPVHWRGQSRRQ